MALQLQLPHSLSFQSRFRCLHLFGPLKRHLYDKWFATNADVKQTVTSCLQALDIYFVYSGMHTLVTGWDKCLHGDNVEFWRVPSAVNVPCRPVHRSQYKLSASVFVAIHFLKLLCVYHYSLFYSFFVSSCAAELCPGQSHFCFRSTVFVDKHWKSLGGMPVHWNVIIAIG